MIDIANAYDKAGYKVNLVTGRLVQRNKPLNEGVKWHKIIRYDRSNNFRRLYTWAIATLQIIWLVWFRFRKNHLLIVSNPPFGILAPLVFRNSYSLLIYDIFPDALVEFGIFSSRSIWIHFWQKANRKVFRGAERIITITEGMKKVLEEYAGDKTIEVIPIWTDNTFLRPVSKNENPFIKKHGLTGKFIVLYSGNLGYSHNVEIMIDLAVRCTDRQIFFLIIGQGDKKKMMEEKIEKHKLSNCALLSWQPVDMLPYTLSSADIAVVTLDKEASHLSIPSKTYNFMSVGVPVLSITDTSSELSMLIKKYNMGTSFHATEIEPMLGFITKMASNKDFHEQLKRNSLNASLDFTNENTAKFVRNTG